MKRTLTFPLWHGKVATQHASSPYVQTQRFRFGMVKLQRWVSSQVPQCLSVKDLQSTSSAAKKAVG